MSNIYKYDDAKRKDLRQMKNDLARMFKTFSEAKAKQTGVTEPGWQFLNELPSVEYY